MKIIRILYLLMLGYDVWMWFGGVGWEVFSGLGGSSFCNIFVIICKLLYFIKWFCEIKYWINVYGYIFVYMIVIFLVLFYKNIFIILDMVYDIDIKKVLMIKILCVCVCV